MDGARIERQRAAVDAAIGRAPVARRVIGDALRVARRPCVTSSFQAGGVVLLHLIREIAPDMPVLFLDTVHHFPETLAYQESLSRRWKLKVVTLRAVEPQPGLWRTSVESCCQRHKVEPLFAALEQYDMWFAALRREQSVTRAGLEVIASFRLPSGRTLVKVSPLAAWSTGDVRAYATAHDIPLLPLHARGFTSVGCAPCTTVPAAGAGSRSGRWQGRKLECGIHVQPPALTESE